MHAKGVSDEQFAKKMAIIDGDLVHMARLACYVGS